MELPLIRLTNSFNNCYLNSLLQSLFSLSRITKYIKRNSKNEHKFYKIILFLLKCDNNVKFNPDVFFPIFLKSEMHLGEQQDSDEILTNFFDKHSELEKLFLCEMSKTLLCICGHTSESKEKINKIYLESYPTILESLKNINQIEILKDYKCDKCSRIGTTKIFNFIESFSKIICFIIKNYRKKINQRLVNNIKMGKYIYKLTSIVIHEGSQHSGHYYTISKRNNKWYIFNDDSRIYEVSCPKELSGIYILFYSKEILHSSTSHSSTSSSSE